jgi:hypothetical protein
MRHDYPSVLACQLSPHPIHIITRTNIYASGNGWQHAIAIPKLDLVIGFYVGNYADRLPLHQDYILNWMILPAVSS